MSGRRVLGLLTWAALGGIATALATGNERAVSLRIWLGATAVAFAGTAVAELIKIVPLAPAEWLWFFKRTGKRNNERPQRIADLRALENLLIRSEDNDRAFTQQLRPRLQEIAWHFLSLNHSLSAAHPERARAVLGDVAWLIDAEVTGRSPTLHELETFMIRLQLPVRESLEES